MQLHRALAMGDRAPDAMAGIFGRDQRAVHQRPVVIDQARVIAGHQRAQQALQEHRAQETQGPAAPVGALLDPRRAGPGV